MKFEQSSPHSANWLKHRIEATLSSLDHLLGMAHNYRREGNFRQAMEIYWMLRDDYAGTTQSMEAEKSLMELAETYERDDALHTARALYERLCDVETVARQYEIVIVQ